MKVVSGGLLVIAVLVVVALHRLHHLLLRHHLHLHVMNAPVIVIGSGMELNGIKGDQITVILHMIVSVNLQTMMEFRVSQVIYSQAPTVLMQTVLVQVEGFKI